MKKKRYWLLTVAFLLFIQLFQIERTVPETDPFEDFLTTTTTSDDVSMPKSLIQSACYDCHSYKTDYPWYGLFVPVSWWLKGHVDGGREHLNFSIWQQYTQKDKKNLLHECIEHIEDKSMPLKSYTLMHPPSRISEDEQGKVITFLRKEMNAIK